MTRHPPMGQEVRNKLLGEGTCRLGRKTPRQLCNLKIRAFLAIKKSSPTSQSLQMKKFDCIEASGMSVLAFVLFLNDKLVLTVDYYSVQTPWLSP